MSSLSQVSITTEQNTKHTGQATANRPGRLRKYLPMYVSIAPYFLVFLAFSLIPTVFSLYLAFQKWNGIAPMTFVGFNNFYYALTDQKFWQAVLNTFQIWIISTIPMLIIALILAFALNLRRKSKFMYQVCYFLPNITSIVAISLIFGSLFSEQFGLINTTLQAANLSGVAWLTEAWPIKWAVALLVIWRWAGYNALIYMAGLQSIPGDIYEAARIDGARTRDIFFHVTIPLLRPIILFTIITSTLGGMTLFVEPQVLLGNSGGVGNEGMTMALYQYSEAFVSNRFGYGAAVGWLMFFIILAFSIVNWQLTRQRDESSN